MDRPVEVLLVEDNPPDARLTREALLAGPIPKRITVVTDGAQAIDYVHRRGEYKDVSRPDIILLDLNLPKWDGLHVLRDIKADPILRAITVIVLTTSDQFRDVDAAYESSANCYIVKPRDLDEFFAVMRGIEEFWMSLAALPTFDTDPLPSFKADESIVPSATEDKQGSATAQLRRQPRRRSFIRREARLSARHGAYRR